MRYVLTSTLSTPTAIEYTGENKDEIINFLREYGIYFTLSENTSFTHDGIVKYLAFEGGRASDSEKICEVGDVIVVQDTGPSLRNKNINNFTFFTTTKQKLEKKFKLERYDSAIRNP